MNKLFLIISLFLLISLPGFCQNVPQKIIPGQFVKSWLLLGPIPLQVQPDPEKSWDHLPVFKTDYPGKLGGEQNLSVKAGDVIKVGKKSMGI